MISQFINFFYGYLYIINKGICPTRQTLKGIVYAALESITSRYKDCKI